MIALPIQPVLRGFPALFSQNFDLDLMLHPLCPLPPLPVWVKKWVKWFAGYLPVKMTPVPPNTAPHSTRYRGNKSTRQVYQLKNVWREKTSSHQISVVRAAVFIQVFRRTGNGSIQPNNTSVGDSAILQIADTRPAWGWRHAH